MLCESIREFGGAYRRSRSSRFSPRAGLASIERRAGCWRTSASSTSTSDQYDVPRLRARQPRVRGAWAEARSDSDFLV
jgi:hypothetical protein